MATSHEKGMIRLGQLTHVLYDDYLARGNALDQCFAAGIKAMEVGGQSDKQINALRKKFRAGFVRQLAVIVKRSGASVAENPT